jgi:hypothetical protein
MTTRRGEMFQKSPDGMPLSSSVPFALSCCTEWDEEQIRSQNLDPSAPSMPPPATMMLRCAQHLRCTRAVHERRIGRDQQEVQLQGWSQRRITCMRLLFGISPGGPRPLSGQGGGVCFPLKCTSVYTL